MSAADYNGNQMAFVKILDFYYGCSQKSSKPGQGRPTNCTVTMTAMCSAPNTSLQDIQEFTYEYNYTVSKNAATSELAYADMDTNGTQYKCFNYTLSAVGQKNQPAVLFVDQVQIVEYFWTPFFGLTAEQKATKIFP